MKLRATDQLHVSSVKPDSLRPGEEFVVSDAHGDELLKRHADKVEKVGDDQPVVKEPAEPIKAEPAPKNKSEQPAANKDDGRNRKRDE